MCSPPAAAASRHRETYHLKRHAHLIDWRGVGKCVRWIAQGFVVHHKDFGFQLEWAGGFWRVLCWGETWSNVCSKRITLTVSWGTGMTAPWTRVLVVEGWEIMESNRALWIFIELSWPWSLLSGKSPVVIYHLGELIPSLTSKLPSTHWQVHPGTFSELPLSISIWFSQNHFTLQAKRTLKMQISSGHTPA